MVGGHGKMGGGRGTRCKHDNLQVSQFQEAGWPDTLSKHRRERRGAERRGEEWGSGKMNQV